MLYTIVSVSQTARSSFFAAICSLQCFRLLFGGSLFYAAVGLGKAREACVSRMRCVGAGVAHFFWGGVALPSQYTAKLDSVGAMCLNIL